MLCSAIIRNPAHFLVSPSFFPPFSPTLAELCYLLPPYKDGRDWCIVRSLLGVYEGGFPMLCSALLSLFLEPPLLLPNRPRRKMLQAPSPIIKVSFPPAVHLLGTNYVVQV